MAIIAFVYEFIGNVLITYLYCITDPDDTLYNLTIIWPLICGLKVIERIDDATIQPIVRRIIDVNKKRLENQDGGDE